MTATITTEDTALKHEVMINTIWATIIHAETLILPFCNQLFKHRKLLI
jgi:hypothetical protein